ncbi:hypothetical protein MTBSS4_60050 [Magnetospirillum sp. SS-4]|nr:hypothetical protein MTBSS4_60050 [Magnetospirillum sp. SS-4]
MNRSAPTGRPEPCPDGKSSAREKGRYEISLVLRNNTIVQHDSRPGFPQESSHGEYCVG